MSRCWNRRSRISSASSATAYANASANTKLYGVNAEIIYPTIGLYAWNITDPTVGRECCTVYNDWILERLGGIVEHTPWIADAAWPGRPYASVDALHAAMVAGRIERAAGGSLEGKTVAVLGVAFKPDTDDVRDAPSLVVIPMLQERGATVRAYDPHARENAEPLLPGAVWCASALEAAEQADLVVVLTEWNEFRALDLESLKARMRGDVLVDLRNIYLPAQARSAGFTYTSIGR